MLFGDKRFAAMRSAMLGWLLLLGNPALAAPGWHEPALLPPGYLSTRGNQIVDRNGEPVRIAAVGWMGTSTVRGAPWGLFAVSLGQALRSIREEGFNALRISWVDAMLRSHATPETGTIDYAKNPELRGLTAIEILDRVVHQAGAIGLKVILDHHNDEGDDGSAAQQPNGLWFDSGPGTNGTDGAGARGTVTAKGFLDDWVAIARRYKGNPTVIGYDLDNEPHAAGRITWGGGGPTDIHRMCTEVGNAILAVDPGPLIICEGPQEYSPPPAASGMSDTVAAPEGDLTGVEARPVVLTVPNKVVYSVHEYPAEIAGRIADAGPNAIRRMNLAWGYLVTRDIAPVWIGEMGASMNSADARAWAATLVPYLNGKDGAQGGPVFKPDQQPISTDWWRWGSGSDRIVPDGTLEPNWRTSRPEQEVVYARLRPIAQPGDVRLHTAPGLHQTSSKPTRP
jgi:endoglucanase